MKYLDYRRCVTQLNVDYQEKLDALGDSRLHGYAEALRELKIWKREQLALLNDDYANARGAGKADNASDLIGDISRQVMLDTVAKERLRAMLTPPINHAVGQLMNYSGSHELLERICELSNGQFTFNGRSSLTRHY